MVMEAQKKSNPVIKMSLAAINFRQEEKSAEWGE